MRPWARLTPLWIMGLAVASWGCATLPPAAVTAFEAPHGITGHRSAHAFFYVVPVNGGVVLVDCGFDADAVAVKAAVGDRRVLGVLITHGHTDHWAGAAQAHAPVFIGAKDAPLLTGGRHSVGLLPHIGEHQLPRPPLPDEIVAIHDGDDVYLGGARFHAIGLPGHTPGSTAWLYKDVLFTGDAVLGERGSLTLAPQVFSDDATRALRSVLRLKSVAFSTVLDGHNGMTKDAKRALRPLLARARREAR